MKTDELRQKYLDFFVSKGHKLCQSDVLVPKWDKSVLFTPAGMNPFKDHFLGKVELEFTRATSCQKCLRTGDIENVGRTAYHHTFFEMLGNFSFGDYFKRDAIVWAWEFLTDKKWLGIDPNKLTATVFLDDDEAAGIWEKDTGLSADRIQRMDEYENFWPAGAPTDGPDGVCGPCSEIFYHPRGIGRGGDVEIWNLVFTQFNRAGDPPDNLAPLPNKNIDTGMGLERAASTLQGVDTNFHIDILRPIVDAAAEVTSIAYDAETNEGRFLRRITDHVRACTFSIHENIYPGASKAEYVIRRLLRRCTLEGRQLGLDEPFLFKLVPAVVSAMRQPYPELGKTSERVQQVIRNEEEKFLQTLDAGLVRIEGIFDRMRSDNLTAVPGTEAADLYQTYGIPPELVESMAVDRKFRFDWDGFKSAMQDHSQASGKIAETVMGDFGPLDEIKKQSKSTQFVGYETCQSDARVVGLVDGDALAESISAGGDGATQLLVLDQTPFYAESGGQVGDTGTIQGNHGCFEVEDVQKSGDLFVHYGKVTDGRMAVGDQVNAMVDTQRRDAIRRAHTATHILHYSLQQTLGSHAQQRGSKVTGDWLRFDFSNLQAVSTSDLATIENRTKDRIAESCPVKAEVLPLSQAKSQGAMMLFGEKYPDPVRMVSIGDFSKELCGGTHLENSAQIGEFEIIAEESVSSGTRRIEAITGELAKQNQKLIGDSVNRLCELLQTGQSNLVQGFDGLVAHVKDLKKQISSGKGGKGEWQPVPGGNPLDYLQQREAMKTISRAMNMSMTDVVDRVAAMIKEADQLQQQLRQMDATEQIDADFLIGLAAQINGIGVIAQQLPMSNPNLMRQLIDQIRKKQSPVAVFLATSQGDDKVILVAGVSNELVEKGIRAGDWVKQVAPVVGGGGGGKPDMAQAGGKDPSKIPEALEAAKEFVAEKVGS